MKRRQPYFQVCISSSFSSPSRDTTSEKQTSIKISTQTSNQQELSALALNTVLRALVGNTIITALKFGVWIQTGSSAMFAEAIHTLADSGNQALLLAGISQSKKAPDKKHQYGYGKATFFWALVSALGTFWSGAGIAVFYGLSEITQMISEKQINDLMTESPVVDNIDNIVPTTSLWVVLGVSFMVDGYVLSRTISELHKTKPANVPMLTYMKKIRDPIQLAVILEDFAACTGVLIAGTGILLTQVLDNKLYDSLASVAIGCMLATVAIRLVRLNQQFLIGYSIDKEIADAIEHILLSRSAIDCISSVQSQWIGPSTFSYKAEVDFDGTFFFTQLRGKYLGNFLKSSDNVDKDSMETLMSFYAEDVTRLVEKEIRNCEKEIKKMYPNCVFIELEPDSKFYNTIALPDASSSQEFFMNERKEIEKISRENSRNES